MLNKVSRMFWSKLVNKSSKYLVKFLNVISLPLLVIYTLLVIRIVRQKRKVQRRGILLTGLDSFTSKTKRRLDLYSVHMPAHVATYKSRLNLNHPNKLEMRGLVLLDLIWTVRLVRRYHLQAVEIYMSGSLVYQFLLSWIFRNELKLVTIFRGELYYYTTRMSEWERFAIKRIAKFSDLILYRETYMDKIISDWNIDTPTVFDPNSTMVRKLDKKEYTGEVLFLNGFKKWRNLEVLIKAIPIVVSQVASAKFTIIGGRSESELSRYQSLLDQSVESNVSIKMWSKEAGNAYDKASIFVLPADLVYLNFSLLEAMERGLAPVLSDVEDVEKIVEHGVSGLVVENKSHIELARGIIELLENKKKLQLMGQAARQVVESKFNDQDRVKKVIRFL